MFADVEIIFDIYEIIIIELYIKRAGKEFVGEKGKIFNDDDRPHTLFCCVDKSHSNACVTQ
jgi:hypothetical protein